MEPKLICWRLTIEKCHVLNESTIVAGFIIWILEVLTSKVFVCCKKKRKKSGRIFVFFIIKFGLDIEVLLYDINQLQFYCYNLWVNITRFNKKDVVSKYVERFNRKYVVARFSLCSLHDNILL